MKFSEKLIKLRKENKLSQEQLASMLDVSRQSVSKWESGQTYPEMDKLLSLCKIFKCTLDELTNDEISKEQIVDNSKKKNTFRNAIYEMLEFINKSISMVKAMSFKQIIKMLFELLVLAIILFILHFPFSLVINIGNSILKYIFGGYHSQLFNLWGGAINVIYWLLFTIIFVYIYKVRFVDKYEEIETIEDKIVDKENKSTIIEKKIIINREQKDHSFALFNILSTLVKWTIKAITVFIGIPLIGTLIFLVFVLIISLILLFKGVIYISVLLGISFLILFNIMLLEIIFKFIVNMNINFKKIFMMFLVSIIGVGASLGIFVFEISKLEYIDGVPEDIKIVTKEYNFTMRDGLFIDTDYAYFIKIINMPNNACYYDENHDYYFCTDFNIEVVEDDSLQDRIEIKLEYADDFTNMYIEDMSKFLYIKKQSTSDFNSLMKINKIIIDNLKHRKIYNYDKIDYATVKIKLSTKTKELLENNARENRKSQEQEYYNNQINQLQQTISSLQEEKYSLEEDLENEKGKNLELQSKIEELENKINEYKDHISELLDK